MTAIVTGQRLSSWATGAALFREVADEQGGETFLLSFSRGKDSVAAAIAIQDAGFDVVPFYCERIPGLSFVEESLDYYERHLFSGRRIIRSLHPSTAGQLRTGTFHPPAWLAVNDSASLADYTYQDVQAVVAYASGLPHTTFTATGLRAADSILRRTNIARQGPLNRTKLTFAAIWDWNIDQVLASLDRRNLMLPADYKIFGRTFDGLMGEFVAPLKRLRPHDYRKVLELFPLVEAEVFRYEKAHGVA